MTDIRTGTSGVRNTRKSFECSQNGCRLDRHSPHAGSSLQLRVGVWSDGFHARVTSYISTVQKECGNRVEGFITCVTITGKAIMPSSNSIMHQYATRRSSTLNQCEGHLTPSSKEGIRICTVQCSVARWVPTCTPTVTTGY